MGKYTNFMTEKTYEILSKDDYIEELRNIRNRFRMFDKALDQFILDHGYSGDLNQVEEKVAYISDKCRQAGVLIPRNVKKWYTEKKGLNRTSDVAFQLCFAFSLNVEESNDFLRRICMFRGFDCHSIKEVVYYFALKHGLRYAEALEILKKVPTVKLGKLPATDIVYTDLIIEEVEEMETVGELVCFLNENANRFGYNNVTACEVIHHLWERISDKENGLALRERELLYRSFDKDEEVQEQEQKRKDKCHLAHSMEEIYMQILGLAGSYTTEIHRERGIKSLLVDNELIHPVAEDSFPDRNGLTKILQGYHVSHETVRKNMILLSFYHFWSQRAIQRMNYLVEEEDSCRCERSIDSQLEEAGYPALYAGNPYDFVFLVAMHSDQPLMTFRDYMREIFFAKQDMNKGMEL